MLESAGDFTVVGMAGSAAEALEALPDVSADVVLLDLRMPGMDGLEFLTTIGRRSSRLKVVVLTNYHSDEDVFRAFQAGAMAYLLKTSSDEELFTAIRNVQAGIRCVPPSIAQQLAERLAQTALTPRELEVLSYVVSGLTNREIGSILFISDKTVRNHVISVLDKLGAKDRTEASTIALRRGLISLESS